MSTPLFDSYLIVDWSAAARPVTGADSVWWALHRRAGGLDACENPPTRAAAMQRIADILAEEAAASRRIMVGFDFPFGYPEGVARRLTGRDEARAIWDWLAAQVEDGPDNANNRFHVAEAINRHYDGVGPCWGRPAAWTHPDLPITKHERHGTDHPPPARRADARCGANSVWQTAYIGSVGSQVLLGLPALRRLVADPRLAGRTAVWPIESGLSVPQAQIVLAEVYPSLINRAIRARRAPGEVKDRAQVRVLAAALAALDAEGGLDALFRGPADLTPDDRAVIEREESWMLGLGDADRLVAALDAAEAPVALPVDSPAAAASARPRPRRAAASTGDGPVLRGPATLRYLRDPAEIYRLSFETVRAESRLDHLPPALAEIAVRLVHACGMPEITARLAWSEDLARSARAALQAGAPILCDCQAVASMIIRDRLPAANEVICTLGDPAVTDRAREIGNTRSAAAVELWGDRMAGALVAIGNAPTALFHLLELIDAGRPRPAAVLAFPVGFVGAAESKAELAARPRGIPFMTLRGRRGGSALAAAAVNALAGQP